MGWTKDQAMKYYDELRPDICETVEIDGEILIVERDTFCSLDPFANSKMAVDLDNINIDRELDMLGLTNRERKMTLHA